MDPDAVRATAAGAAGFVIGGTLGLFVHEFGHAGAAWLVGLEPRLISIGHGKIVFRCRVRSAWLVVRTFPLYGFAARLPDAAARGAAQATVLAAGPLASLALVAVACAALAAVFDRASIETIEALVGAASAAAGQLSVSLLPMTFKRKGDPRRHATDGLKLWRIARAGDIDKFRERYAKLMKAGLAENETVPEPSARAPEMLYQLGRGDLKEAWAQADAANVLTGLLRGSELNAEERRFLLDRLGLNAYFKV